MKNGKGILYYSNGTIRYDGYFLNDKFDKYKENYVVGKTKF